MGKVSATVAAVHQCAPPAYDAAADAAHAAWAGVHASTFAAWATVAVGLVAACIAIVLPNLDRRRRTRAALHCLGAAFAIAQAVSRMVEAWSDRESALLRELIDKTDPAMLALDQFFALASAEENSTNFALNLQTELMLFRNYIRYGLDSGATMTNAAFIKKKYRVISQDFPARERQLLRLCKLWNVTVEEISINRDGEEVASAVGSHGLA
jgi:hypothetical protein